MYSFEVFRFCIVKLWPDCFLVTYLSVTWCTLFCLYGIVQRLQMAMCFFVLLIIFNFSFICGKHCLSES